jgi:hypothetical protein
VSQTSDSGVLQKNLQLVSQYFVARRACRLQSVLQVAAKIASCNIIFVFNKNQPLWSPAFDLRMIKCERL